MAKQKIRINTTLEFDIDNESDILALVQDCSSKHKLNKLLESALRVSTSSTDRESDLKNGLKGITVDIDRAKFFQQAKQETESRKLIYADELNNLSVDLASYQASIDSALKNMQEELVKLRVLADSGKLLGLKTKTELLNTEMLLLSSTTSRLQGMIWGKTGRPKTSEEKEEAFKHNLSDLAEQVIIYLSEHYTENIAELRSLFAVDTAPQQNEQLLQIMAQVLSSLSTIQAQPAVQPVAVEKAETTHKEMQPVIQKTMPGKSTVVKTESMPESQEKVPEEQEIVPDFGAALDMFGDAF